MGTETYINAEDAFGALKRWRDNLEFLLDESRFFQDLLDRHFLKLLESDRLEAAQKLIERLNLFSNTDLQELLMRLRDSEQSLSEVSDQLDSSQRAIFSELSDSMQDAEVEFKMLKQKIFQLLSGLVELRKSDPPQK